MNIKNTLLTLIPIIISSIHSLAVESAINIPLENIRVNTNYQYYKPNEIYQSYSEIFAKQKKKFEDDQTEKARIEKRRPRQLYFYDINPLAEQTNHSNSDNQKCGLTIQLVVKDPKTANDIFLTKRNFNRSQGHGSISKYLQEHFMIHGKSAKIEYTVEVEYSPSIEGTGTQTVQSLEVNVLKASINGADWPSKKSGKGFSSLF